MVGGLFKGRDREPVQEIPTERIQRIQRSFRRRLSDQVEDVFHRACIEDDIQTAEDLYILLESMQHRRRQLYAVDRRLNNDGIVSARHALERCRIRNKHKMPSPDFSASEPGAGQVTQEASGEIDTAATRTGGSEIAAKRHCPLHRYLMDYVAYMTEIASGQASRDETRYRAIGHYTFPDEGINPRRRANMGA
jgi:hypothetical protein